MEWIIKIEEKEVDIIENKKLPMRNRRIKVKFDPQKEELKFIGQYKTKNGEWIDFSEKSHSMIIDLNQIQELLYNVYKKMEEKIVAYENIAEAFEVIKLIEINDENNTNDELA